MLRALAVQELTCHVYNTGRRECAMFKLFSLLGFLKDGTISPLSLQLAQNMLVPKIAGVLK
jgi:hypothetical protein